MKMSRISELSSGKWVSVISQTLISITSAFVFIFLDILDVIMCFFFRVVDEFLEGKPASCYCMGREKNLEDSVGESELSESLHGRKNVFRNMGLLKNSTTCSQKGQFCVEKKKKKNRWSDCGCESCLSWMNNNGSDSKLHLVVKEPEREKLANDDDDERPLQHVIFIHGFISSSSLWEETVFPNLSEHSKQNYKLYAVDLLGFGRSPKPMDCLYTLKDHLEMIEKSVIIPFKLDSFHLVAHSMGCVIALALAAKHLESVKSVSLVAPPYFSSSKGDASSEAFARLAPRRVWPPLLFGSAFMSWYEHLGRCVCFVLCRNHRTWERILKLLTGRRDHHFLITDITRHTHHSAWHTMHNIVCGGAKFLDEYLDVLTAARAKMYVIQGSKDEVVPVECSFNMKMKAPEMELHIIPNANHNTVILGRANKFTMDLESFWASID
ncbi:hypothetical protein ACS0TY_031118 [Phlomoides rotata]